jgi:membrane protein required for colicin V production
VAVVLNWLDWVLLVLILLFALRGYSRGLVRELGGLAALLVGLAVAVPYAPRLGEQLGRAFPLVVEGLAAQLSASAAGTEASANPLLTSPLGDLFGLGLPVGTLIGHWLGYGVLTVIAFILIFLVVAGLVRWISSLASAAVNRTPLGVINRLLGLLLGGVIGAVILGLVLSLVGFFLQLGAQPGAPGPWQAALKHSALAPYLQQWFFAVAMQLKAWLQPV